MFIGHIKEIVRHPVKSFRGERVQQTKIMDYGLYGDRSHAYEDADTGNFLTITQLQEMVQYQARFAGEPSMEQYPDVEVITPEGKVYHWDDEDLIKELEHLSNRTITTREYRPTHVPIGPIAVENILLATDASLEKLEDLWGKDQVDSRRFRPNLIISLNEKLPFVEDDWVGRRMKIGNETEIEFVGHCKRCMIITVDPDHAGRDASLHKTLIKERNNNFGVYASVKRTGDIYAGDEVHLLD
ncbi:MOSC domain-containing protein [Virgibacillus sp. MSP4-1]|uniref:MOSC domain-containing protein n=1 Tax=Virgibacillus sp. MSP4-1 TaxID=2700081 RepID=UPI0003A2ADF5|nr:MOSC N-terminal beta barrel domain-containing protein [Virgibacillus sp. MSP4-1]QHS24437.1 MOSC domain-containing protein [Virgibacillus sp. MSP4-1]